jgi:hypothetical protein
VLSIKQHSKKNKITRGIATPPTCKREANKLTKIVSASTKKRQDSAYEANKLTKTKFPACLRKEMNIEIECEQ